MMERVAMAWPSDGNVKVCVIGRDRRVDFRPREHAEPHP